MAKTVTDLLEQSPRVYDAKMVRKGKRCGKTTGLGFFRFMHNLFELMETEPAMRRTNAAIELAVRKEFAKHPTIVRAMSGSGQWKSTSVNTMRRLYNRGQLLNRIENYRPPKRISLRWGLPEVGEDARAIQDWMRKNKKSHPDLVAVDTMFGRRSLPVEDIRDKCLHFGIKDDRFFSQKEIDNWESLQAEFSGKKKKNARNKRNASDDNSSVSAKR